MTKKLKRYQYGGDTDSGYQENSPDVNKKYNLIDSNNITMDRVKKKLLLTPISKDGKKGKPVLAKPGDNNHYFPNHSSVLETPVKKKGGEPSPEKAREMLHNPPHGKPLSDQQRKYFGYLSNKAYGGSTNGDGGVKMGLLQEGGTNEMAMSYPKGFDPQTLTQYLPQGQSPLSDTQLGSYGYNKPEGSSQYKTPSGDYRAYKTITPDTAEWKSSSNPYFTPPIAKQSQPTITSKPINPTLPMVSNKPTVPVTQRRGVQKLGFNTHNAGANMFGFQHGGSLIAYKGPDGNHNLTQEDMRLLPGTYRDGGVPPADYGDHLDNPPFARGGESKSFNNEDMFADKKNHFINWLKNKSIDIVHGDIINDHLDFMDSIDQHLLHGGNVGLPEIPEFNMGGLANPYGKKDGGCHECDRKPEMNIGGYWHGGIYGELAELKGDSMNYGGDIPIPDLEKDIPDYMKKGGYKTPSAHRRQTTHGYTVDNSSYQGDHDLSGLRSFCGGDINHDCITAAINSPDAHVRKMATMAQQIRGSKFQMGGPQVPGTGQIQDPFSQDNQTPEYNFMDNVNPQVGPTTPVQGSYPYTQGDRNRVTNASTNLPNYMINNQSNKSAMQTGLDVTKNVVAPGMPEAKGPNQKTQRGPNPMAANMLIAGIDTAANIFGQKDVRNKENFLKNKTHADQVFGAESSGNRGDYSVNEGYLRPNEYSTGKYMKSGGEYKNGEYYMSDTEIQKLKDRGYNIEYLD